MVCMYGDHRAGTAVSWWFESEQEYTTPQECATPPYPAVPTEFQVDVIINDAMLLAPVIYNMCTDINSSHVFLCNNLYRIRRVLVHHRFRIRLTIRVQCALHHKNDINLKFCRDSTHSGVAHSWGVMYSWSEFGYSMRCCHVVCGDDAYCAHCPCSSV